MVIISIQKPPVKGDHFLNPLRLVFIAFNLLSDHLSKEIILLGSQRWSLKQVLLKSHIFNRSNIFDSSQLCEYSILTLFLKLFKILKKNLSFEKDSQFLAKDLTDFCSKLSS